MTDDSLDLLLSALTPTHARWEDGIRAMRVMFKCLEPRPSIYHMVCVLHRVRPGWSADGPGARYPGG